MVVYGRTNFTKKYLGALFKVSNDSNLLLKPCQHRKTLFKKNIEKTFKAFKFKDYNLLLKHLNANSLVVYRRTHFNKNIEETIHGV